MADKGGMMASSSSGRYIELMNFLLKSEDLDELPKANLESERTPFFSGLLKSECLLFDDADGGRRTLSTSGLFSFEILPLEERPEPHHRRASFFAMLFSREKLPEDPVPDRGAVGRRPAH